MKKPDGKNTLASTVPLTTLVDAEDEFPISVSIMKAGDGVVLVHFGHSFTLGVNESNFRELQYIVDMVAAELYGSLNLPDSEDGEIRG